MDKFFIKRRLATVESNNDRITPEAKLWASVILQAWEDYFNPTCLDSSDDVDTAEAFLFSRRPGWMEWRNSVCMMAVDMSGDTLRQAALKERSRRENDQKHG